MVGFTENALEIYQRGQTAIPQMKTTLIYSFTCGGATLFKKKKLQEGPRTIFFFIYLEVAKVDSEMYD